MYIVWFYHSNSSSQTKVVGVLVGLSVKVFVTTEEGVVG